MQNKIELVIPILLPTITHLKRTMIKVEYFNSSRLRSQSISTYLRVISDSSILHLTF